MFSPQTLSFIQGGDDIVDDDHNHGYHDQDYHDDDHEILLYHDRKLFPLSIKPDMEENV